MNRVGPKTVAQPQPKTTSEASAKTEVAATQPKTWGPTERTRGAQQVIPGSQGSEIICPVLRAMVADGRMKMASDGTVKLDDLRQAVKDVGGSPSLGHA